MMKELTSKMKRREFLVRVSEVGGGVVLTPVVLSLAGLTLPGCKQSAEGSGGPGKIFGVEFVVDAAGEPVASGGHTHDFFIPQVNLNDPNLGPGYTELTSPTAGHRHRISLSADDLVKIVDVGMFATGTTTRVSAHEHDFIVG